MENDVLVEPSSTPAEALPDFSKYTGPQWAEYQKTGELPKETTEKPNADATHEPGQDGTGKSGAASDAADTTTIKQDPPKPNREERRNQKLNNENRDLKARLEALEKAQAKPAETKPAASETKIPKLKDYATPEEWEDAKDAWHEKRTADAVRDAIRSERETQKQADQQAESEKTVESLTKSFATKVKEYRKTLTEDTFAEDFTEVNNFIKENNLGYLADALVESDPKLFTYFGEHFDELEALAKLSPTAALREFGRLEVSEKIKGPAPKTRTAAKPIGSEVRGSAAVTDEDEQLAEAARTGNMKAYQRIMDKREAAETRR